MHAVGWVWTSDDTAPPVATTGYASWQSSVVMVASWLLGLVQVIR